MQSNFYILYNIDINRISDNVAGMMYRPTSSGLLVPTSYQFGSNQIFQVKIAFILYRYILFAMHTQTLTIKLSDEFLRSKIRLAKIEAD